MDSEKMNFRQNSHVIRINERTRHHDVTIIELRQY